jgi:hypothetical protein
MALVAALPEKTDDLDGLLETGLTHFRFWPALPDDVLVEILAGPDSQKESAGHERGGGGGRLRNDRGVDAHARAGDRSADDEALGRLRNGAQDAPHEGALPLPVDPRMEMIGDEGEAEPGVLRNLGVPNEVGRRLLFARELVAKGNKEVPIASRGARKGTLRGRLAGGFLRLHEPEVCAAAVEEQHLIVRQGRLELDLTLGEIFAAE